MINVWCRHANEHYFLIASDEEGTYREAFRIYVVGGKVSGVVLSAFIYTEKEICDDLGFVLLTDKEVGEFVKKHVESLLYLIREYFSSKLGIEL